MDNDEHLAVLASDLPDHFVFWPKPSLFLFLRRNRHKIGQHNFCRIDRKRCLENVRIVDVTSARLRVAFGTNAPPAADHWINNCTENRSAVESRPTKPVERTAV